MPNITNTLTEPTPDRIQRVRQFVMSIINEVGEHPECELKQSWGQSTPYLKAEMIKDIQSIANSAIEQGKDKYIVVGVNEDTRAFVGCNRADYDEADIRQLVEAHLEPVPEFEILCLQTEEGKDFIVMRIPSQVNRPFITKKPIADNNKTYIQEGEIWLKPGGVGTGSTRKRRVISPTELLNMIDIESRVSQEINARLSQMLPAIRLEEQTRLRDQSINAVSALTCSDEEFEIYIKQLLSAENNAQFNIVIEDLRDKTVDVWKGSASSGTLSREEILRIKSREFIPALRRLVLFGLLLIKYTASMKWFNKIVDILIAIFECSKDLGYKVMGTSENESSNSLDEHSSHTVPAVESLLAAYLLMGYEISQKDSCTYTRLLFPRIVQYPGDPFSSNILEYFYLFWPIPSGWGSPCVRHGYLVQSRYGMSDRIEHLLGGRERILSNTLQVECLIDWHSFISLHQSSPELSAYFRTEYPKVRTDIIAHYFYDKYNYILPLVNKIWLSLHKEREHGHWLFDDALIPIFKSLGAIKLKILFAKFLIYIENEHTRFMMGSGRFPYDIPWSSEILQVIEQIRSAKR